MFSKFFKLIGALLLLSLGIYFLVDHLYLSKHIIVKSGETFVENITLEEGTLELEKNSILNGNIKINSGLIRLADGAKIIGSIEMGEGEILTGKNAEFLKSITLKNGQINLGEENILKETLFLDKSHVTLFKGTVLEKDLNINSGSLLMEENTQIKGSLHVNSEVDIEKHSSALMGNIKPAVYRVYDWPEALQYFDILPEAHKNQVGFIMLTQQGNGLILKEGIKRASQYFEGVYDYVDGKLVEKDLSDPALAENFFKKAKEFFAKQPEYRMYYLDIGATTEEYAHDPNFADIYLPEEDSTLILHEMGHVMDFKDDFSDFHIPKFPWTKEDAVSNYGATHPGEDFAEAYRIYALNQDKFLDLIKENPERQNKYNYLEEFVFD